MQRMDLTNAGAKLEQAGDAFCTVRAHTAAQWDDVMRRHLDQQFFRPVDGHLRQALEAIRRMGEALRKAERECGDT